MDPLIVVVLGVLAVVAVQRFAGRVGVAAPLVLVLLGIGISLLPQVPAVDVDPDLVLEVVLPLLLYSSAVSMPTMDFRRDVQTIAGLSVLLVVGSAVAVGLLLTWLVPSVGLWTGIAVGAVISPTDAVATSIVRRAGVSRRVVTMLEGESMLNDASALVLLRTAIAATATAVSFWGVLGDFVWAVGAAVVVGWVVGRANLWVRSRIGQPTLNVAISLVVPLLAFLPAEHLGASGLVAAVTAGLVTGNGSARWLSAEDRMTEGAVWRTLELLLESGVFLVLGLQLYGLVSDVREVHGSLTVAAEVGIVAGAVVIVVRAAFVAVSVWQLNRRRLLRPEYRDRLADVQGRLDSGEAFEREPRRLPGADAERIERITSGRIAQFRTRLRRRQADIDYLLAEPIGPREAALLVWAGMRGAVTLAAAQSLPAGTPQRSLLVLVAFVVAVGTLLVQGSTLPVLVRRLGLARDDTAQLADERAALRDELSAAIDALLADPGLCWRGGLPYDAQVLTRARLLRAKASSASSSSDDGVPTSAQVRDLMLAMIGTRRQTLLAARADGRYSSRTLEAALRDLDAEELGLSLRGG